MDSTFAEVLNKALEMGEAGIAKASAMIENVAPELWEIMIRQVYADAIADLIVGGLIFCLVYISFLKLYKIGKANDWYDDGPVIGATATGIVSAGVAIFCIVAISNLVRVLINPKFYAIKNISGLF